MNLFRYLQGLLILFWGTILLSQEEPINKPKQSELPDPQKLAIEAQKAADLLKKKDTGSGTQNIQKEVAKAIDDLIKQLQNPPPMSLPPMMPPPDMNKMPPPDMSMNMNMGGGGMGGMSGMSGMSMGGGGMNNSGKSGMSDPSGGVGSIKNPPLGMGGMSGMAGMGGMTGMTPSQGEKGSSSRREKRLQEKEKGMSAGNDPKKKEQGMNEKKEPMGVVGMLPKEKNGMTGMDMGMKDKGMSGEMVMNEKGIGGQPEKAPPPKENPPRKSDRLSELYRDLWGTLPDRARQELDVYDRERYMPRYADLLSRYFSNIAEAKKKGSDK